MSRKVINTPKSFEYKVGIKLLYGTLSKLKRTGEEKKKEPKGDTKLSEFHD